MRIKLTKRQQQKLLGLAVLAAALVFSWLFPGLFGEGTPPAAAQGGASGSAQDTVNSPADASDPAEGALYFIDVGQGDASLICSGGEYVLIDGGPGSAEDELVAYLEMLGIERFRAVIATHPHEDHIGGLDRVLERFPADAFYMPDRDATTVCFERMLDAVEEQGLEITIPEPGETLSFGTAELEFLSPAPGSNYEDTNDYSIVTRLTMDGLTALFMGDAEKPVERELLQSRFPLDCDVIKLGHHGSSTSSAEDFLRAVSPDTAIISCAKENDYGHPHRETIQTLKELGIDWLCTYDNTVIITPPGAAA